MGKKKSQKTVYTTRDILLSGILVLFYTVGILGLHTHWRLVFLSLTPFHLLLSFACLLAGIGKLNTKQLLALLFVGSFGFLVEYIGVHTQLIFGCYSYGANLGWKLFEVPLIISLNWIMISYSSFALTQGLVASKWVRIAIGASLMTVLDVLIEPVALSSDFWSWCSGNVPWSNYVSWWLVSFVIQSALVFLAPKIKQPVPIILYVCMAMFFLINGLT